MKWNEIVPVVISIIVIILVSVVEKQSKLAAAVTATMPLTAPLALWIVYSSNQGERQAITQFTQSMLIGILPTVAFIAAVWLAARLGFKLVPMILIGYAVWGVALVALLSVRKALGG